MDNSLIGIKKFKVLLIISIYRLLLDEIYIRIIVPNYEYYGFHNYRNFNWLLMSWFYLIIMTYLYGKIFLSKHRRSSSLVVCVLYIISFVPSTSLLSMGLFTHGYSVAIIIYWLTLYFTQCWNLKRKATPFPNIVVGKFQLGDRVLFLLGVISVTTVLYISFAYTGFRINFNLYSVYDLRIEYRTYSLPLILDYFFAWSKIINQILYAYLLVKKKKYYAILLFFVQILSFGIDGSKTTLFMLFVSTLVVLGYRFIKNVSLRIVVPYAVTGISVLSLLELFVLKTSNIALFVLRRMLFLTNYISYCYYDFFGHNEPDYFRSSFLRYFGVDSPYKGEGYDISTIIGDLYIMRGMSCNNGLIADSVANLGKIGLIIMPIMLVAVLRIYDKCTIDMDERMILAITLYLSILLSNSFLLTTLLTHGLILILIVLSFVKNSESKKSVTFN